MGSPVWKRASARCDFPLQSRPHAEPVSTATLLGRESALETSGLRCASTLGSWPPETCWFQSGEPDGETWVGSREVAVCLVCSGGRVRFFFLNWGLGVFPIKCSMHVNIFNNHFAFFLLLLSLSFVQNYVPTVFENYTASFEIDTQRIELSLWDTSGKNTPRGSRGRCAAGLGIWCPVR